MATLNDFKRLADLKGVKYYILVKRDGAVVSANMEDAVVLSSTIVMSGLNSEGLETKMGGQRHRYLTIERSDGEDLVVFSLGNYFLGIIKILNCDSLQAITEVIGFLKDLTMKGKNHPGIRD